MLAVGAHASPDYRAGIVGQLLASLRDHFAITFHVQLLKMGGKAAQVMIVRKYGVGFRTPEVAVPNTEKCHYHWQILLQRGISEVGVHSVSARQQGAEIVHTNGQSYWQANGRPERVAASHPVPHWKYIVSMNPEGFRGWHVCCYRQKMPAYGGFVSAIF